LLKKLLRLQQIDLEIEKYNERETEIPKEKRKFEVQRDRLAAELEERKKVCRDLELEQRECESEIEQKQAQIQKYDQQLFSVKKNEEYQALLHEIDMLKKQIGLKEERIIAIMMEMDDAKARLEEDKKRVEAEMKEIDRQCADVEAELARTVDERKQLEQERAPVAKQVDPKLMQRYARIRSRKRKGPAVVPISGQSCSGCHMYVTPQIINETLAGEKMHACAHCGRLLYDVSNVKDDAETDAEPAR
jgi:hypothetical protein